MNTYTHYSLAARLEPVFNPPDRAAYAWGAVVPDIRYLAGLQRSQTHLPPERLQAWRKHYPQLTSFIMGYQVHCLLDQVDGARMVGAAFPIHLITQITRKKLSPQQYVMLLELYQIETSQPLPPIMGGHNEILDELGITPEQSRLCSEVFYEYTCAPSLDTAFSAFQRLGLIQDGRIEKYMKAARSIQNRLMFKKLLFISIQNSQIEQKSLDFVTRSREMQALIRQPAREPVRYWIR